MKTPILGLVLGGLCLVGIGGLWVRQQRTEEALTLLRSENRRLQGELDRQSLASAEERRTATDRLAKAEALMDQLGNGQLIAPAAPDDSVKALVEHGLQPLMEARSAANSASAPVSSHSADGQLLQRKWGPEQVVGPPDTHEGGDLPTAWAPLSSRGEGEEWLHVGYDQAVELSEVHVYETYNPGAIAKLAAVLPNGQEMVLWSGETPLAEPPINTTFSVPPGVHARSIKIYLDRARAPGWNEIDAVELVARNGVRQWASSAVASTSFAEQPGR